MRQGRVFVVGSANMDMVLRVPRFPRPGETLSGSDLELIPGGKGANQACAAAGLGGDVHFVGCTGDDAFGSQLLQSLEAARVNISRTRRSTKPTGCASIYVDTRGQNSIVISPGANADVTPAHVREVLTDLNSADFVLLQLEIPLDTVQWTLELAKEAGATSILDPAPARPLRPSTLKLANLLTPNQSEAAALLDLESQETLDDRAVAHITSDLRKIGASRVILKLGDGGCAISDETGVTLVPGHPLEVVDTTAAGDVFNGGLAVALWEGKSTLNAAQLANAAAALSVTRRGAQTSIPSRAEVDAFIDANPALPVRRAAKLARQ